MFAARFAQRAQRTAQTGARVLRRNMSAEAHHEIPDQKFILRELLTGLGIGLGCGVAWKSWQWSDKARRIENNNKWDRYYPVWANQIKLDMQAATAAAETPEEDAE